jgi:excisionase family DNA binding protein
MTVDEISRRLNIGRRAVYVMLEQGILPGIRLGQRWLITRHAYEQWEMTCGMRANSESANLTGLKGEPEVTVN